MRVFFSVGEPSGDLHGANLIKELRSRREDIEFVGFGGPKMAAAGCALHADLTELAIMWFLRAILNIHRFLGLLLEADRYFQLHRPDVVVLIDYPGFNWWVARRAKARGIPVVYYGTPQIWAWANYRVHKLRRLVDHALCKLPFEPAWYHRFQCHATYVGHPYFDDLDQQTIDTDFVASLGEDPYVVLLPGSRRQEVAGNLATFLKTIEFVHQTVPKTRFAIASFNEQQAEMARKMVDEHGGQAKPTIYVARTRELIRKADCCLACSGSVSLELLYECTPTVIHYRIGKLGDFLQRKFRRCKFITLVNLLKSDQRFEPRTDYDPDDTRFLREAPFPEYLTPVDKSAEMAHHLVRWLSSESQRQSVVAELEPLRASFVKAGASRKAANYLLEHVLTATAAKKAPGVLPGRAA